MYSFKPDGKQYEDSYEDHFSPNRMDWVKKYAYTYIRV